MKPQHHDLAWASPRPLWRGATQSVRPQLLRFASDDFMERALHLLDTDPARIADLVARPETWRDPPAAMDPSADAARHVPLPTAMKANRRQRFLGRVPSPIPPPTAPLKLWQPAHQRHYLVAGSLACALPGLPEHQLAGGQERVGFVLRRLINTAEHAWISDEAGGRWQRVDEGLAPAEELLPLFPLRHSEAGADGEGRTRTLWAGLIPVGRREAYLSGPVSAAPVSLAAGQRAALDPPPPPAATPSVMGRLTDLRLTVFEPWKAMIAAAARAAAALDKSKGDECRLRAFAANSDFQMQSWLLLLDLKRWIAAHLDEVARAIAGGGAPASGSRQRPVYDWLVAAVPGDPLTNALKDGLIFTSQQPPNTPLGDVIKPMKANLFDALKALPADPPGAPHPLEAITTHYTAKVAVNAAQAAAWPAFHFPLAGLTPQGAVVGPWQVPPAPAPSAEQIAAIHYPPGTAPADASVISNPVEAGAALDAVAAVFGRALVEQVAEAAPPQPHAMKLRDMAVKTVGDPGHFVIRMVHLNEDCGPLHPPTLSAASDLFQLGSFFDPDAPVRPLTITLPSDTSPSGLRKHGRGTAFVMSDMLCGQVQRARGLGLVDLIRHVLPFPLHKQLDVGDGGGCKGNGMEIGMICSISIPIITLCALILLMIMVSLLDFIFRWLPWFIACFPVPKLKGKTP